jgi:hypothetical protein
MRILHLPVNIASQISYTVRALRSLGAEARGLARQSSVIQDHREIETVDWAGKVNHASRLARSICWRLKLLRRVAWADVIHWHWGDTTWRGLDLRFIASCRKARLVEFWGDDLRDPTIASGDNPLLAAMYKQDHERATDRGLKAQAVFSHRGFDCLIPGYELSDYLQPAHFSGYYQTRAGLILEDFVPRYPLETNRKPLLVHAPSHKGVKGTDAVIAAVGKLAAHYSFDFKLLHDMPRAQALATVATCDVFLDQFVLGCEGLAAHEAMAMGKPVVCFIKPSLLSRYPPSLPIVMADQNTLSKTISNLLENGPRRRELGIRSREYVDQYHDARKVAAELMEIYANVISLKKEAKDGNPVIRNRHWRQLKPETAQAKGIH